MISECIVKGALRGEEKSLVEVIKHYRRYIKTVATRGLPSGGIMLDEEMEGEIITELLLAIIKVGEKRGETAFD